MMKINGKKVGAFVLAAGAMGAAAGSAHALTAQEFANLLRNSGSSELEIKLQNWDEGTTYLPGNGAVGTIGGAGDVKGVIPAGSAAALDAVGTPGTPKNGEPGEDSWGILRVTQIFGDADGFLNPIWDASKGGEVTVMFWGLTDLYFDQLGGAGSGQDRIEGAGLQTAWYFDETPDFTPDPNNDGDGPGARTSVSTYPTVTDGTQLFTAHSESGHINTVGSNGGANVEFRSDFNFASSTGQGTTFLSINLGSGILDSELDSNRFAPIAPGHLAADLKVTFTTQPDLIDGWLVRSNDPVNAFLVPVPAAAFAGLPMLAGLGLARKLRRKG